jgi:hypothetical protein
MIFDERGEAEGKRKICHEPCPLRWSSNQEKKEVDWMEKETVVSGKMYFEDLPERIQDVTIDFIESIIENQERSETIKEKA